MRLGSFRYPALPPLDDGESAFAVYEGLRARVTLTGERVIVSRFGHTSIRYETIIDVSGGTSAGPNFATWRENVTIWGGLYLLSVDNHEEWVHIPEGKEAAAQIRSRAPNVWTGHGDVWDWFKTVRQQLQ